MITNEPYVEERRVFGKAINYDPHELAIKYADKKPVDIAAVVSDAVVGSIDIGQPDPYRIYRLLKSGIKDTQGFYACILIDDISSEHRRRVASHPKTRRRLIEQAMHSDSDIGGAIGDALYAENNYILSEDQRYITVTRLPLTRPGEGCPFAGNNKTNEVDPLFTKFAAWATDLVLSHHEAFETVTHEQTLTSV